MSENITTVFFSGTYDQIIKIKNKSLGSFYYAQDKDAWYKYFGTPPRLKRVSDIYTIETEDDRLVLTKDQLFEGKLYIVKETGIIWWNQTGCPSDWVSIGMQIKLRDVDEELIGMQPSTNGCVEIYSTEVLRTAVEKATNIIVSDETLNQKIESLIVQLNEYEQLISRFTDDFNTKCQELKSLIEQTQTRLSNVSELKRL